WGRLAAATARCGESERIVEVLVNIRGESGGYCVRVRPSDGESVASGDSLPLSMPPDSLRLGTKFDAQSRPICEVWHIRQTADACRSAWEADGWTTETAPPSPGVDSVSMLTNCMLTNEGESICALFPSALTPASRGSLLILVRMPGGPN